MPACVTHYFFAKNVLNSLANKSEIDECAFLWGAQGPDFLFCPSFIPWRKDKSISVYGSRLHEAAPSVTLNAMRDFLKHHDDKAYRSYVLGFVCHYSLDCTAHPYINSLAAVFAKECPTETESTMHGEIEGSLDTIVLRRETGRLPSEISLGKMFPKNEAVQRRIAKLYREVISRVLGDEVSEKVLFQSAKDAHFVFSLLTDRTGMKKRLFDIIENGRPHTIGSHFVPLTERDDVDYANIQENEWQTGESVSSKNFFDLTAEAELLAKTLIENFDSGDFAKLTGDKPFG